MLVYIVVQENTSIVFGVYQKEETALQTANSLNTNYLVDENKYFVIHRPIIEY